MAGLCFRQSRMRPDCRPVFNVRSRSGAVRHGRLRRCTTLGPITVFRAGHHSLHHTHVGDRIGQRSGNRRPLQNRLGEGIGLERVLIADVEPDLFGFAKIAAALQPNPAGAIGRGVERDFDLDPAGRAENVYALVGGDLRAAGKGGCCRRRIPLRPTSAGRRELPGRARCVRARAVARVVEKPRQRDRVAADVHQSRRRPCQADCGCCCGSSLKYENCVSIVRSSPMRPSRTNWRAVCHWGWKRYMKASITFNCGCAAAPFG